MSDEFFERRVGTVLQGKWTLEKLLGVGGMAAVYVGRHHIGRRDAIKILHPSGARSSEMRARFEQEARAVSRLGHRGAVRIDDIDTADDGSPFLVMELLDGESLGDRLQRGGATVDDALRWTDELLDVLGAAHALDIVHRDIKPDNVFLLRDGRVKLLDFGIARMRDAASLQTATGVAMGTLPYMAPEQVRGDRVDPRADLFAVGATLVRAIARRGVHEAQSEAELYLKMGTQPAPPARALVPSASEGLWAVVDHALAFDRERRYPSAEAMRLDVQALRAGAPPARALGAIRLEPTVIERGAAAPTVGDVASARTAAPLHPTRPDHGLGAAPAGTAAPPAAATSPPGVVISRRLLVLLAGSILAGVLLAVLVLSLVLGGRPDDATSPSVAFDPALAPPSTAAPPPRTTPASRRGDDPRKAEVKARESEKKREEKAREAERKREEKEREAERKREEKEREAEKKREEKERD